MIQKRQYPQQQHEQLSQDQCFQHPHNPTTPTPITTQLQSNTYLNQNQAMLSSQLDNAPLQVGRQEQQKSCLTVIQKRKKILLWVLFFGMFMFLCIISYQIKIKIKREIQKYRQQNSKQIKINIKTDIQQPNIHIQPTKIQQDINQNLSTQKIVNTQSQTIKDKQQIISKQIAKPIFYTNEQLRNNALSRNYKQGLKQYYNNIKQQVLIINVKFNNGYRTTPNKSSIKTELYTYIINIPPDTQCPNQQPCLQQLQKLLSKNPKVMQSIWIFPSSVDRVNDGYYRMLMDYLDQNMYNYESKLMDIGYTYQFINNFVSKNCKWIIYTTPGLILQKINIEQATKNNKLVYLLNISNNKQSTIQKKKVQDLTHQQLSNIVIIFKKQLLDFITPNNFGYQNVYTLEEIIVYPVLVIGEFGGTLAVVQGQQQIGIYGQFTSYFTNKQNKRIQYYLKPTKKVNILSSAPAYQYNQFVCFIALPTNLSQSNISELITQIGNYLSHIERNTSKNVFVKKSLCFIIILPYIYGQGEHKIRILAMLNKVIELNSYNIHIRIRIRSENISISPALQAYEAANSYCPTNSTIFISRMNVQPYFSNILQSTSDKVSGLCGNKNKWLLIGNYQIGDQKISNLQQLSIPKNSSRKQYVHYYSSHFFHAQIFCQSLMKDLRLEIFKWQQLQFYSTQASYVLPLIQRSIDNYYLQKNPLYKILYQRLQTQKQQKQINGLNFRQPMKSIKQKGIKPIEYSQLNNYAYKVSVPERIPRIIHQIWLSDAKSISPMRKAMIDTLISTNPEFQYRLWTQQNRTRQNFPITYDGILKFQQISKKQKKNYRALIADLMRIQILYNFGGIYMDLKIQGKKSLIPFLRYESFYFLANEEFMVNGLIGSAQGNRHFKKILQQFFRPELLHRPVAHIYELTGGSKLVQAYIKKQIYTQVLNFQQFIFQGPRPCIYNSTNIQPQKDQKVFQGTTAFVKKTKYKVLIPCRQDMQKYLQIYDIVGRTYFPGAQQFS